MPKHCFPPLEIVKNVYIKSLKWLLTQKRLLHLKIGGEYLDGSFSRPDGQGCWVPVPILRAEQFDRTGAIKADPFETRTDIRKRNYTQPWQETDCVTILLFGHIFGIVQMKSIDVVWIELIN